MGSVNIGNVNIFNFGDRSPFDLNLFRGSSAHECVQARGILDAFFAQAIMPGGCYGGKDVALPHCGCIQPPNINLSGPPAAKGVEQIAENKWKTAGGYIIEAEGKQCAWNITGPDGKKLTRVWGDPHVWEEDGTKWDFTKDSDFVLPDGTRIEAITNYDPSKGNGQSVTVGLNIMNGQDRFEVKGVNTGKPTATHHLDAFEHRALSLTTNPNKDTFHLAGDSTDIHWLRERDGNLDGVITGSTKIKEGNHKIYEQKVDPKLMASVAPGMRPAPGTPAYNTMLNSYMNDEYAQTMGQLFGPAGLALSLPNAYATHARQIQGEFLNSLFGGWPTYFPGYKEPMDALRGFIDLLREETDWRRGLQFCQHAYPILA